VPQSAEKIHGKNLNNRRDSVHTDQGTSRTRFSSLTRIVAILPLCLLFTGMRADDANAKLTAGQDIIAAPASVLDDASDGGATNTAQQAFDERQNFITPVGLAVDGGGLIPVGTAISSHMIFLNTDESGPGASDQNVVWTFDANILGVMSNSSGSLEVASSPVAGAPGTIYPLAPFGARGLEAGSDSYTVAGNQITVSMTVTEPGDWIRVITEANLEVGLDIHPTSCPNPLAQRNQGSVPVAILGSADLDVNDIDPFSLQLEGVEPSRVGYEDVVGPYSGDLCGCTTDGPDGYTDLILKFSAPDLVAALGTLTQNEDVVLTLTGSLQNGLTFTGSDCMVIRGKIKKPSEKTEWSNMKSLYR
jgi:hypothetical protein